MKVRDIIKELYKYSGDYEIKDLDFEYFDKVLSEKEIKSLYNEHAKKELLNEIKVLKEKVKKLEEDEDVDLEVYPCNVDVDVVGDILFNDEKQCLSVNYRKNEPLYQVSSNHGENCKDDFVFVKCEKEDLETGDTIYAKHSFEDYEFDALEHVLKVIKNDSDNNLECVRVEEDGDITVSYVLFSGSLYKLVRKNTEYCFVGL